MTDEEMAEQRKAIREAMASRARKEREAEAEREAAEWPELDDD